MIRPILMLCVIMLLAANVGCTGNRQTYDVVVRNESNWPVTLWLTKNGPPHESRWLSPEVLAIQNPHLDKPVAGVIVDPGQTASTGKVRGTFPAGVEAVLRVYPGEHSLTDLLAISRGSPNRIDHVLPPGRSDLLITMRHGRISVERAGISSASTD